MGTNPSIWDRALQSLSPDVQKIINSTRTKKRDVLQAVLDEAEAKRALSLRKRWKFTRSNGEVVIVRDLLEKIVSWIQRFKETGDTMVQYDPTHAALPWAAVRFLLQMAVSEVQVFAAMADDLENISRMLVRYRVFEGLYLRGSQSEAELKLEDALTRLYAEILSHLAAAVQFYDERSVTRILKSPFRTVDDTRAKALVEREKEVDAFASLSDAETLRSLEAAFTRLTTQSSQSLSEERFNQILEWLTVAPYYHHHQFITQSRLPSAGKWLLKHPSFMNWRLSSSSSLLLLHGIPGSGKSTLCSVVIDSLLPVSSTNQAVTPAPLAYFYCANPRSEKSRSSADDIMRTILFQLAIDSSHRTKMRDFLCSEYERQTALARAGKMDMAKLRVKDCVRLMLELAELDPLTIVLDGLDSVEDSERPDLIGAFEELVKKADNVVKVFVSSRTTSRSAAKPTHEFEIQTSSQETRADMEAFIDHLVNKAVTSKLLLDGRPCPDTREMLKQALVNGAGEMFLWAKLQLERVCRETVEEDIVAVLKDKLPHGINALYQESLNHMLNSGEVARDIAVRVLSCILYMRDPLTPGALLAALAAGKHSTLVLPQVLAICANFVVLDSNCNVLRVAHQSVQDFLMRHETFDPAIANNMLASMCIDACSRGMNSASGTGKALEIPSEDFYVYAAMYWPIHSETAARLGNAVSTKVLMEDVKSFIFDEEWETTLSFDAWMGNIRDLVPLLPRGHPMKPALDAISLSDSGFLFCLSTFGLNCILKEALSNLKDVDINQTNELGHTAVYVAAALGQRESVQTLSGLGAHLNIKCGRHGSPLHAACFEGHIDVAELLLQLGANISCGSVFRNAFQAACRGRREMVALFLVELASVINSQDDHENALEEAALVGFVQVVQKLQASPFSSLIANDPEKKTRKIEMSIKGGQIGILRQFLGQNAGNIDLLPANGVALATLHNHQGVVEFLLDQGLDVEAEGTFGSPLRVASLLNYQSLVRLLLDRGAQIDSCGSMGDALQAAATNGHTSIVQVLIQEGAKMNRNAGFYGSALVAAAYHGHVDAVEVLLDAEGKTCELKVTEDAFHAAAKGGHQEVIILMLRKGFRYRNQPSKAACKKSTDRLLPLKALLRDASPRRRQSQGLPGRMRTSTTENKIETKPPTKPPITDMHAIFKIALGNFSVSIRSTAMEYSSTDETSHPSYHSDLSSATFLGSKATAQLLVDHQGVLNFPNGTIDRALIDAAANGQADIVKFLMVHVASQRPTECRSLIERALSAAHREQQAGIVEVVLNFSSQHFSQKHYAELEKTISTTTERFDRGEVSWDSMVTEFNNSCQSGETRIVTEMLAKEHDKLLSSTEMHYGLLSCALYGHLGLMEILLETPSFRKQLQLSGEDVFVAAAAGGWIHIMKTLGTYKTELLPPATQAASRALTVASHHGHIEVVKYLILELFTYINTETPDKDFDSILTNAMPADDLIHYDMDSSSDDCSSDDCSSSSESNSSVVKMHRVKQTKAVNISPLYAALRAFSRFETSRHDSRRLVVLGEDVKKADKHQQEQVVICLLERGADVNLHPERRLSPMQLAAKYCSEHVLSHFIALNAHRSKLRDSGIRERSLISIVARRELSTLSLIRQLLDAGSAVPEDHDQQIHLLDGILCFFEGDDSRKTFDSCFRDPDGRFLVAPSLEYVFQEGPGAAAFFLLSLMPHLQTTDARWALVLQMAVVIDDHRFVDLLLSRGTDVNATGYYYGTALQAAARFGHAKMIRRLLTAGAKVNLLQGLWQTPLRAALVNGSESIVQVLLENGADLELGFSIPQDCYSPQFEASELELMSSLQLAVETRSSRIVQMLLDKGADPNLDITTSQFPLMAAAGNGDLGIVKSLISSGAAVNVRGKDHWRQEHASPLHAAAAGNYLDVVILLLSFGTAIDSCGETFGALLELAARYGHLKVLRYLLSAGDRVGAEAAVNSAVRNYHVEIMQELLAVEAPIPTTVLATACRLGHLKMIEFLLERVIDIENSQDALDEAFEVADDSCMKLLLSYTSCTAAQFLNACAIGSVATIKGILNEGKVYANQSAGKSGDFPLQVAALHLRLDVVKLLISHEAKIDCESGKHGSPLISVLESYSAPILGAKVDKTNQDDMQAVLAKLCLPKFMSPKKLPYFFGDLVERPAPTSFLRFSDCMEILKTLVAHGASVTGIERPLGSPIHIACALGDKTMVLYLTENGASIDETSGHFEKVIFAAIYGRNTSIVSLILDNAVVPTHIHGRYGTALHYACALGDGPITRMLLEHGADDDVRDHQGRTVVAIALKSHNNVELRHKQWDPSVKRVETPLEVLAKLVKLRICDEDLAAVSADAGFSASSTLSLLLSLDEDYRDVICRLLSMTVSFDTIDLLKERSRSVGTKETVLPTAYPDVTITTDDLRLQSSITSIKRLLDFDRELCIAEAVVLQALKLGHRHPTRWGNDHGTLESLFQRDSRLRVTQTMLREARCETDMEILLEHLDSKMKISDEVVDSISRLDTNEKLPILRLLTQFDAGIRFSPRVVLRCIEKSFQALDTLAMLLKHDPSIFITSSIFLRVFETKCFDMDAHRSKLVELLHTHGKRVFFTNEIKTATENVFRLESQKTQRQRLFSLQTLDESYCDPEVEGPEEDETATPPTATS